MSGKLIFYFIAFLIALFITFMLAVELYKTCVGSYYQTGGSAKTDKSNSLPLNQQTSESNSDCMKTGCSGQICSDKPENTTCEWKCEYGCYKDADCKKINGKCGFAQTPELKKCLDDCK